MSQIPFDQPIIGPMQFTPQMFQGLQTSLPQAFQPVVGQAAAVLLTKAMEMARTNPARMSTFNHLVVNNFANPNLPRAVELTIRLMIQKAMEKNDLGKIGNYLTTGADQALLYMASSILTKTPDMQRASTQQAIQAAYQNDANYTRIQPELFSIDLNRLGQQQQPQTPQMNQNTAPIFENYQNVFAGVNQTPNPTGQSFGGTWSTNLQPTQPTQPNDALQQAPFFNTGAQQPQQPQKSAIPVVDFNLVPAEIPAAIQLSFPTVTIQGVNEMDIKSHSVVYFGNEEIPLDMSSRRSDLQLEALQLHREASRPETIEAPLLLNKSLLMETNIDSAVFIMSVAMQQNVFHGSISKVYRQFSLILNPVACSETAKVAMEVIQKASSFNRIPELFKAFLKLIKDPSNPKENELQVLNFYSYLDGKLTNAVNDFLAYSLRLPEISIVSFCADFVDLEKYLLDKRGTQYSRALVVWTQKFFDQLKNGYQQNASEVIDNYFDSEVVPSTGWFPVYHSVTLLSLTRKEVNYTVGPKGSLIDPKMTALLDSLTQGLFRNKKELDTPTSVDWLITADDYRFRIAEDALNPGQFYLFKA